jgi:hypothetical protein
VQDGAEILIGDGLMARRGKRMLAAMAAAAPPGTITSAHYTGTRRLLMMYGAGLEQRRLALAKHRAAGGRVAVWDLGYWDRDDAMRLAVDSLHPTAEQLALAPDGCRRGHALREDANPAGPVMLVGLGRKSAALYRLQPMEWERKRLQVLKKRFPGRRILWRPKGRFEEQMPGTTYHYGLPIEAALRGCSLVVCRHSNVAVDACIAGVPVECEAGAALALYEGNPTPTVEQRLEFLRRLGWWNWRPSEASQAWDWIDMVTRCA